MFNIAARVNCERGIGQENCKESVYANLGLPEAQKADKDQICVAKKSSWQVRIGGATPLAAKDEQPRGMGSLD